MSTVPHGQGPYYGTAAQSPAMNAGTPEGLDFSDHGHEAGVAPADEHRVYHNLPTSMAADAVAMNSATMGLENLAGYGAFAANNQASLQEQRPIRAPKSRRPKVSKTNGDPAALDDEDDGGKDGHKKTSRACDHCRRKKVRLTIEQIRPNID